MAWPRTLAQLLCLAAIAMCGLGALFVTRWNDLDVTAPVLTLVATLPALVVGMAMASLRPANRVAPLLCLVGVVPLAVIGLDSLFADVVRKYPGDIGVWPAHVAVSQGSWMWLYVPVALLMLLFPDGHLPGRRWRWAVAGLIAVPIAFTVAQASSGEPYPAPFESVRPALGAAPPSLYAASTLLLPLFLGLLVVAAAAMIIKYRRATNHVVRAQLRWFALAAMLLPLTLLLCWVSYLLFDRADLVVVGLAALAIGVPAATAIALHRHDLYDVDRAFSATVTYGVVSAVLLGVFTGAAALSGLALGRDSAAVAAVVTALCAVAFAPVRARLQRPLDRWLYPRRHTVRATLTTLLRDVDAGSRAPEDLQATLRVCLDDPDLRVGYHLPGQTDLLDASGRPVAVGSTVTVPVTLGGALVGILLPGPGHASRHLMAEAASGSALLMDLTRSRLHIARALSDVAESRSRLLRAGYAERQRLQRDLHDGAQQRLVSLGMALRLAQRHSDEPDFDVDGLIDQAVTDLGTAVAELRAIAHGLRPAALDGGLAPALEALAATLPLPVRLSVSTEPIPDVVATTAYYVATEALANALKHADADSIDLHVTRSEGRLLLRITDDGCGGARPYPGSGLTGLADRVGASGGTLTISTASPRGTIVEAALPCG